jgi:outer membrane receptor protein involved in Fe transport
LSRRSNQPGVWFKLVLGWTSRELMRTTIVQFLLLIVLASSLVVRANAQIHNGTVSGVVSDPTGALIANAVVSLEHPVAGQRHQLVTGNAGEFVFNNVPFDQYTLRVMAGGFEAASRPVVVRSNLPIRVEVVLTVAGSKASVEVSSQENLIERDSSSSATTIGESSVRHAPRTSRNRVLQELVSTAPGSATENNGLIHVRGVDDGILYVIDGIPIVDRLDAVSASPIDTDTINSMQVITGNIPAEFGGRSAAVVIVHPKSGIDSPFVGDFTLGAGDFRTDEIAAGIGGRFRRNFGFYFNSATHRSDRFLDPVDLGNFNNHGGGVNINLRTDWHPTATDTLIFNVAGNGSDFDVPNDSDQELAGQRQRQKLRDNSQAFTWQHVWNTRTVSDFAYFRRSHESMLESNESALPLFAEQDREHIRHGFLGSLTHERGGHNLKAGAEFQRVSPREFFKFFVTDEEEARERAITETVIAFDKDNPFVFRDHSARNQYSAYVQDAVSPLKNLSVQLGVRYDHTRLLVSAQEFSPRLGAVYFISRSNTAIRGSFNRLYQPPQVDNLLLSASEQARQLSPFATSEGGGSAAIKPERTSAWEVGFAQDVGGLFKLDASYWWRNFRNVGDPNVFFNTTVIFPNSVAEGYSRGVDVRVDVPERRGFSGYLSYTNQRILQTGPINGGLFLTDEFIEIGPGTKFIPDQDQRNTGSFAINYQHRRSRLLLSLSGRHESGVPLEVDADTLEQLKAAPGAELVDFDRGRVKPRTIFNIAAGLMIFSRDRIAGSLQFNVQNVFDWAFAYNFGNPFEGTHFGIPRRWSGTLEFNFH